MGKAAGWAERFPFDSGVGHGSAVWGAIVRGATSAAVVGGWPVDWALPWFAPAWSQSAFGGYYARVPVRRTAGFLSQPTGRRANYYLGLAGSLVLLLRAVGDWL